MSILENIDLNSLIVFDGVVVTGGITSAANRLGMAKSRVSTEISRLEKKLGIMLFSRTTRRVTVTDAGRQLHSEIQPLLNGIEEAIGNAGSSKSELSGALRISATVNYAVQTLAPALVEFSALHPKLQIDLRTSDRVTDLIAEGIDISIRVGWLRNSTLRAVKLADFEQHVVASPQYLDKVGLLQQPEDLSRCDWIALTLLPAPLTWKFSSFNGKRAIVQVKSRIRADSPSTVLAMVRSGAGISAIEHFHAQADIRAGRLVRLFNDWGLDAGGIYAVFAPGRHVSLKIRTFIEFYRRYLASH